MLANAPWASLRWMSTVAQRLVTSLDPGRIRPGRGNEIHLDFYRGAAQRPLPNMS
jgi:hypothetical protein